MPKLIYAHGQLTFAICDGEDIDRIVHAIRAYLAEMAELHTLSPALQADRKAYVELLSQLTSSAPKGTDWTTAHPTHTTNQEG